MRVVSLGWLAALFFSLASFGAPPAAQADAGFRCGSRLVREGDTEDDVSRRCGKPDAVRTWTEYQNESIWENGHKVDRSIAVVFDEWKFDFGRDRLIRYATFVQGRLARSRTGGYGE
jgi:hypothetical protein